MSELKWLPGPNLEPSFGSIPCIETNEVVNLSINVDLDHDDILYPDLVPFLAVHAGCVAAIWSGVTWQAIAICAVLYLLRMFAITGGYHRYFSHRAYFDKPGISIRPCVPRAEYCPEERAVVGRETSASSFALGYRTGCAFTQAQGLRVQSRWLDFPSTARRH